VALVATLRTHPATDPMPPFHVPEAPSGATRAFGEWRVSVSVTPTEIGSIGFSVGPLRDASRHGGKFGWIAHAFVVTNTGTRTVHLTDTGTSTFLGPPDRALLVAELGCGFSFHGPDGSVNAGVCLTSWSGHTLQPGDSLSWKISIFKGLPGMSPLAAGTYVFEQPLNYGGADGRGINHVTLDVTYTIAAR